MLFLSNAVTVVNEVMTCVFTLKPKARQKKLKTKNYKKWNNAKSKTSSIVNKVKIYNSKVNNLSLSSI